TNLRTGRNCWSSRPGAHSPIRAALTATSTPSTNSEECMASMNAVLLTSDSWAPAGPSRRATSNAWPSDVLAAAPHRFRESDQVGSQRLRILRGQHRPGERDAERGTDFPAGIV